MSRTQIIVAACIIIGGLFYLASETANNYQGLMRTEHHRAS
jgi:hypothetical protein